MSRYSVTETRSGRRVQSSYGASSNRTALGYWVPLALTVTAATVGLAAWIWSERKEEVEDSSGDEVYNTGGRPPTGQASMSGAIQPGPMSGPGGFQGPPPPQGGYAGPPQPEWGGSRSVGGQSTGVERVEDTGLVARMSTALGINRTSSPGKAYDWASRNLSAGVAAAAATVGGALGYSETNKEQYEDHSRWNEEAEARDSISQSREVKKTGTSNEYYSGAVPLPRTSSFTNNQKRKTVVIVVSSLEAGHGDEDVGQHASILASLPEFVNHATTRIFVLIYAPSLTAHPLSPAATTNDNNGSTRRSGSVSGSRSGSQQPRRLSQSRNSSFSMIATDEGRTPGEFPSGDSNGGILTTVDPQPIDESTTSLYKTLHNQAMALVDRDTMIIPFTSQQGHKHIIRSLQPEIVYIQESMCGTEGEVVAELNGWVRTTVVVIGDEGGLGGLVDTDTEDEGARKGSSYGEKWWKREDRTGVGRGVGVVEALRVGEDWRRRVGGED